LLWHGVAASHYPGRGGDRFHDLSHLDGWGRHALVQHAHDLCGDGVCERGAGVGSRGCAPGTWGGRTTVALRTVWHTHSWPPASPGTAMQQRSGSHNDSNEHNRVSPVRVPAGAWAATSWLRRPAPRCLAQATWGLGASESGVSGTWGPRRHAPDSSRASMVPSPFWSAMSHTFLISPSSSRASSELMALRQWGGGAKTAVGGRPIRSGNA
jgi:hypothetical protein